MRELSIGARAGIVSVLILLAFGVAWHLAVATSGGQTITEAEFEALGVDPAVLTPERAAKLLADISGVGAAQVDTLAKLSSFIFSMARNHR